MTEFVDRPKTMPGPPVASITAIPAERLDPHRDQIQGDDAAAVAVRVADEAQELPHLVLVDEALHLEAAHLLVERVEELLPGRRPGEGGAVESRSPEPPEVEETLRRAVEHHAHPVEQVDDPGGRVAHRLDRRLVREEVAAVDRVVEVDLGRVALPLRVDRSVDAALRAHRVAALDRHDREEVHGDAHLRRADGRHQPREPAADDDDPVARHRAPITCGTPGSTGRR